MEESKVESLSEGRPPNPFAGSYKQSFRTSCVAGSSMKTTLVRHSSLVKVTSEVSFSPDMLKDSHEMDFIPMVRSGAWADCGRRAFMEDAHVCFDDFICDYGLKKCGEGPSAFYGIFDGHYGKYAANFASKHLPRFIREDKDFPREIDTVLSSAFLQTDNAFAEACSIDASLESGTTALAALILGRSLIVANAGDCRAVLCRSGKAVAMSKDHKPKCPKEKMRIESCGGFVDDDGYMNGDINVARALGDWHLKRMKDIGGEALIAEPELMRTKLSEVDEFLIMACDGIWDVFTSQNAVDFARKKLQKHNDPVMCCKDLVDEAFKRKSLDNLSAVVVCFHSNPPPNLVVPRTSVHRSISAEGLTELQSFLDSLGSLDNFMN
ncbi:hypothetical protein GIB67_030653 [Kingdonia uniflora]|uniref:protein-serine/threonine phosphatase n=1 Tax=Kingdonia uniflora TaxID=39325 RepID=A0A7J7NIX2_9MAGN|nr:hypothetical protein GIB67_030653 [Kingdonia uniflora]